MVIGRPALLGREDECALLDRLVAHQALAEATDPRAHPARRAWHHALAVAGK
jgi:hypothetical protein